eukprot:13650210-Alexandrium_andersonii.AAC.1
MAEPNPSVAASMGAAVDEPMPESQDVPRGELDAPVPESSDARDSEPPQETVQDTLDSNVTEHTATSASTAEE